MPRRKESEKRKAIADPIYNDTTLTKVINVIMKGGQKTVAERIVYEALNLVEKKTNNPPIEVFRKALSNVKPFVEVKSRRVGGSTYQVPVDVRPERRDSLSIRWLINAAKARSERTMMERLAGEILDASNNAGAAVKKKEDTHRMAEANKAFSHFKW